MKPSKLILAILILFTSFLICSGQEKTAAVLVDEFEEIGCDDFLGRLDNYFVQLRDEPSSVGHAVIYGKRGELLKNLRYEHWLKGHIEFRKFPGSRINIIRGEESKNFKVQLWKVPAGAEKPEILESSWDFSLSSSNKPFIFYDNSFDVICLSAGYEAMYSEILKSNPGMRGHLVIYEKSAKEFNQTRNKLLNILSEIPQTRLRFFYVKSNDSNIEFWLVPQKKRN